MKFIQRKLGRQLSARFKFREIKALYGTCSLIFILISVTLLLYEATTQSSLLRTNERELTHNVVSEVNG